MEKQVRKFRSFEEAEEADREFYRSLSGDQRLQLMLELIAQTYGDPPPRFQYVYRVAKREQR